MPRIADSSALRLLLLQGTVDDTSTPVRRFRGTIIDKGDQKSIVGMSGGPIVGFYLGAGLTFGGRGLKAFSASARQKI